MGGGMKKLTSTIILVGILVTAAVKNASLIPEPVIMILLGASLIGLSLFGRRIFFRKG
jgi:hypothetical protein